MARCGLDGLRQFRCDIFQAVEKSVYDLVEFFRHMLEGIGSRLLGGEGIMSELDDGAVELPPPPPRPMCNPPPHAPRSPHGITAHLIEDYAKTNPCNGRADGDAEILHDLL